MFYLSVVLGASQDHIIELLESGFYLVFGGGTGTGKGTGIRASMALTRNGQVLGTASPAYLRDVVGDNTHPNRSIGASEFEVLLKENPQLLALVRNGNRRDTAEIGLKMPAGKGWENVTVNVFGFKAVDFHDSMDSHILGRAIGWDMDVSKDLDVAMDAEYLADLLAPVRRWLERRAQVILQRWTREHVKMLWDSKEFRSRVRGFENSYGRHGVMAAVLLLIEELFVFGAAERIRALMNSREPELSELAQEVQEAIVELAGEDVRPDSELAENAVLARVNEDRAGRKLPPRRSIKAGLRDHGFNSKGQDWIMGRKNRSGLNRGKTVILPYEKVLAWRASLGRDSTNSTNSTTTHMENSALGAHGAPLPEPPSPLLQRALGLARDRRQTRPGEPVGFVLAHVRDQLRVAGLPALTEAEARKLEDRLTEPRTRVIPGVGTITLLKHSVSGRPLAPPDPGRAEKVRRIRESFLGTMDPGARQVRPLVPSPPTTPPEGYP